jgi:1-deoxy-D-xylulose-5-phosphate reductoisomerase
MKRILIFGSTGSVGLNALDVVRKNKKYFRVEGLCTYENIDKLCRQIKEFSPSCVCVVNEKKAGALKKKIGTRIRIFRGAEGLEEFSRLTGDISLMAISGIAALAPLMINLKYAKRVALANKEAVITAGKFIFEAAAKFNTEIIPVDSEINAFFQLFTETRRSFARVYLTASGGPLLGYTKRQLSGIGVAQALSHPTWKMGSRITIDSATLVNKGFEAIETHRFFGVGYDNIRIVIHRESIVHGLVEFDDHTIFSCMYPTDMRIPISFALFYPERHGGNKALDFERNFGLSFRPINIAAYPLLELILAAAKRGDNSLVILNACDETAIKYFLEEKIKFTAIHGAMRHIFDIYPAQKIKNLGDIFYWDKWAREKTKEYLAKGKG